MHQPVAPRRQQRVSGLPACGSLRTCTAPAVCICCSGAVLRQNNGHRNGTWIWYCLNWGVCACFSATASAAIWWLCGPPCRATGTTAEGDGARRRDRRLNAPLPAPSQHAWRCSHTSSCCSVWCMQATQVRELALYSKTSSLQLLRWQFCTQKIHVPGGRGTRQS